MELPEFPDAVRKSFWKPLRDCSLLRPAPLRYIEDNGTKEELIGKDPREIMDMGVALSFVPEDRLGMGLVGDMDLTDNMMLRSFQQRAFCVSPDRKTSEKTGRKCSGRAWKW